MKLTTTIERVAFPKPMEIQEKLKQGKVWMILITDQGTAKGKMSWEPQSGERLNLDGDWTVYNGQKEFKFESAMPDVPEDPRALLHYVCELSEGIGERLEERIWEELGEDWQKIKKDDVKGVTQKRIDVIMEKLEYVKNNRLQVDTVSFMMANGCTFLLAEKAWDQWEAETIGVVKSNCYRLTELKQVGFCHVDNGIRQSFKIANDDTRRIRAGIFYAMKTVLQKDGSTVIAWDNLRQKAFEILQVSPQMICDETAKMLQEGFLVGFPDVMKLAFAIDYDRELKIWEYVKCN